MKKSLFLLTAVISLYACAPEARQVRQPALRDDAFPEGKIEVKTIENSAPHAAEIVVAVLPFANNTGDAKWDASCNSVVETISVELAARKAFRLVERQRIDELLKEMSLGDIGPVDQKTAVKIGGMLGANVLALGGLSTLGKELRVSMRLVKVETGEIVGGITEDGKRSADPSALALRATQELFGGFSRK